MGMAMETVQGKKIYGGIVIGKIFHYRKEDSQIRRCQIEDIDAEWKRYEKAKETAIEQLTVLYDTTKEKVGEVNAQIFEVHAMMLEDEDYNDCIKGIIENQSMNAEYAVATAGDRFAEMFANMEDDYFKARAVDIKDISERIIHILLGRESQQDMGAEPVILMADDLVPSETVQLDKELLLALITKKSSVNSHTAILARTMNIPAITKVDIRAEWHGKTAIVDSYREQVIIDPSEEVLQEYRVLLEQEKEKKELLQTLKGKENVTLDGRSIQIYANIGKPEDIPGVLLNDAGGIGLFRSEFLYLGRDDFPSEEEQFQVYRQVAEVMGDKKVIIRTLDVGADKQVDYFHLPQEENPAMGYRAIRICLTQRDIFKTQLRALYRASAYGNLAVMYPMITSLWELQEIKKMASEVKAELERDGIPCKEMEQGIMIETPAAVMISDLLSKEADFFSIGTNDLTQYTLAIDRQNTMLDDFYDPHHEAVLRMIQMVIDNGHKEGIWVGICGELGADVDLMETFLAMGLDEVSVSASCVLPLRKKVRETRLCEKK